MTKVGADRLEQLMEAIPKASSEGSLKQMFESARATINSITTKGSLDRARLYEQLDELRVQRTTELQRGDNGAGSQGN